ncbi:hypothetical protein [Burkholderia gladioli]|uniref:hypothetical protein n=1 Tax=Burkholderia gladioli TaxID=28095 RepID=UPI003B986296
MSDDAQFWRNLLAAMTREIDDGEYGQPWRGTENAPGHAHNVPGVWDADNGSKAGKPCAWCMTWNRARAALAALPAPAIPAVDPVAIIEQCAVLAATHSQYPVETDFDHGYAKARRDAAHSIRALKAASAISESEDALLTAARRAIPALAHAAERNPAYQRDYEELSKAIEDAARKGGGS